jgi:PAS domain S-box-containing protein
MSATGGPQPPLTTDSQQIFPGGSEMARRMREHDWSQSGLGDPSRWPAHLRVSLGLCLMSRHPIVIYWGPAFEVLYNDAYISFLGPDKHPRVLGAPARDCWREVWPEIGPMLEGVVSTAQATWSEDLLMHIARRLPREEVFVRLSYGPILRPDGGGVDGIFCPCTETTERVIGQRRLDTLHRLGSRSAERRSCEAVCQEAIRVLAGNPRDVPFAALYLAQAGRYDVRLCASTDPQTARSRLPARVDLAPGALAHLLRELSRTLAGAAPVQQVLGRIMTGATFDRPVGLLLVGVSPGLVLDENYRAFFDLVAGHVGSALDDAEDFTAQHERAEALTAIDRAKTSFFTNVSHEFRTPLTLMLGPLEELRGLVEPGLQKELVQTARRNAGRLLKLVNTLLDFARVEGGRADAHFRPTDLSALTAELASNFRSACERAGLALRVDCPPLPQAVHVDADQWEKVVLNLLSNAFKFTLEGGIDVALRPSADGSCAELTVSDTGSGIPKGEMPKLFSRFQRIEGQVGRSIEGSGIGLALVQELVRLHGGTIEADSVEGRGTRFTVRLPFGTAHLPAAAVSDEATPPATPSQASAYVGEALQWLEPDHAADADSGPMPLDALAPRSAARAGAARILVADDNADLRDYLARLLGAEYDVLTARDGFEALDVALADRPDLLVADAMMPGLDGFELIARLRADTRTRTLPIIVLSARAGEEARIEGLGSGADDYLVKPFSARELLARVRAHLAAARIRHEADLARHESEELLRAALTAAGAGSWSFDPRTEQAEWSPETYALFGIDPSTPASTQAGMMQIHPEDVASFVKRRDEQLAQEGRFDIEYRVNHPIDGLRWHQVRGRKLDDGRVLGISLDITERKRAEEALREADRRKDEFLATLAHELRNPLAPISNALLLLRIAGSESMASGLHEVLQRQVHHLVRLVDDLMEASRISRGMLELKRRPLELAEVLRTAVETSKPLIDAGRHTFRLILPDEPMPVDGDPVRLAQVVANLLNNAAKYTDDGGHIELSARRDGDSATISVRDNGIGIEAEHVPRLFQMFAQGDRNHGRAQGGLGIGLSLVERLVQLHGGTVQAHSEGPGCGSVFTVRLPLASTVAPAEEPAPTLMDIQERRVLVVDDNRDEADTLSMLLRISGAEARVEYDGASALATANAWRPSVVLLDLGMPRMDGFEVARRLRADASLEGIKLIALTGWGQDHDRLRTRAGGFDHHLIKPVDIDLLHSLLASIDGPLGHGAGEAR